MAQSTACEQAENTVSLSNISPVNTYRMTRRFNLEFNGSPASYSNGGHDAASWSPQNGKVAACFGVEDCFESPSENIVQNLLSNAVVHEVTLLGCKNDLPFGIGFNCNIMPGNEVTRTGHRYAFTAPANSKSDSILSLWKSSGESTDQQLWRTKYPLYNASNLDTEGVLTVNGQTYSFVDKDHPVIDLLRANAEVINQNIEENSLIDGRWFKVSKQVLSTCCKELRNNVLQNISTQNLALFKGQITRLNGKDWTSLSASDDISDLINPEILKSKNEARINDAIQDVMNTRRNVTVRLQIDFEMYGNAEGAGA